MRRRNPQRYATLLKLRKRKEDLKSGEMAEATRELHNAQAFQRELMAYQREILDRARTDQGAFDAADVRAVHQFGRYLSDRIVSQDAQIQILRHKVTTTRSELEESMKDRRIVEKIMSNARDVVNQHRLKTEQREHDEVASIRAAIHTQKRQRTVNDHG